MTQKCRNADFLARRHDECMCGILISACKKSPHKTRVASWTTTVQECIDIVNDFYVMEMITFSLYLKKIVLCIKFWIKWIKYVNPLRPDFVEVLHEWPVVFLIFLLANPLHSYFLLSPIPHGLFFNYFVCTLSLPKCTVPKIWKFVDGRRKDTPSSLCNINCCPKKQQQKKPKKQITAFSSQMRSKMQKYVWNFPVC